MKFIILISFLPFIGVATAYEYYGYRENSAIVPVSRDGIAYERFLLLNEKVQDGEWTIDLIFLGDSITERWEEEGKNVWDDFYEPRNALNLGIKGDRTQHVLWRLENGNIEGISPKVAVVMIGTNNSATDRNTTSEMLAGVTSVVQELQSRLPATKILLLAVFPRGEDFNDQRGKIAQVNQALRKLDDNHSVRFLDIGHVFLRPDGSISREVMPDALHLSPSGYRLWAETMEPVLSDLLADQ